MKKLIVLFLILATQVAVATAPTEGEKARVLVVHSYGSEHICGKPQGDGVVAGLAAHGWLTGKNLELESVFMDTKKTYTTPEAIRARAKLAMEAVERFDPHVLVVLDDNAIREVMLPLIDREGLSIVFSGMNGQPQDYDKKVKFLRSVAAPGHNVTGVYEKLHLVKSLRVMAAALGELRPGDHVVGITDY